MVDRALKPVSGRVVVVAVNGEYTVKRLRKSGGAVWLDPANAAYQSVRIMDGESLHIFGVVKHSIHTLR